jgi:carbamoyl-phosphate synthase small subunit
MSGGKAWIALESGLVLEGRSVGAAGEKGGDLVFNTAMTGYHEILTDPSYAGQVVIMTYPLMGNYGVADEDAESAAAWAEAFVLREMSAIPSNRRATRSLPQWLADHGVVAIEGVDTRRLTRIVREVGSLRCVVSTLDGDAASLVAKAKAAPATDGRDLTVGVTCREPYRWSAGYEQSYPGLGGAAEGARFRVVAYDFGAKRNILKSLVHEGFDVTVVPAGTSADDVLGMEPDAVFLSNGPGDPAAVRPAIAALDKLVGKKPIFGICLGHQILSIVLGAKTHKMPFGHHGANHPVRDQITGRVEITSQNHSFAVDPASMPKHLEVTHVNLNDGTVEGMRSTKAPVFSVQYHPEAAPGPLDSAHLFRRFRELVEGGRKTTVGAR